MKTEPTLEIVRPLFYIPCQVVEGIISTNMGSHGYVGITNMAHKVNTNVELVC